MGVGVSAASIYYVIESQANTLHGAFSPSSSRSKIASEYDECVLKEREKEIERMDRWIEEREAHAYERWQRRSLR